MTESNRPSSETPLNPALANREETTYDLSPTPAPVDTASAREGQGEGWPLIWLLVAIAGILLAVYFVL